MPTSMTARSTAVAASCQRPAAVTASNQSDAPLLKKLPSDYMRDMYYTSQPMEMTDPALLKETFRAMDAEHTLLWSSDWPHWDFDLPGRLFGLPFLSDQGRRNILGETARKVFNL
jgi:predicted TIM-barrel fold metal-dependent hydrolase